MPKQKQNKRAKSFTNLFFSAQHVRLFTAAAGNIAQLVNPRHNTEKRGPRKHEENFVLRQNRSILDYLRVEYVKFMSKVVVSV